MIHTSRKAGKKISKKAGFPPGSLIHVGQTFSESGELELSVYDKSNFDRFTGSEPAELFKYINPSRVNWLNFVGLHNTLFVEQVGDQFELHPLLLEDVLNSEHRPSSEHYKEAVFFTLKGVNKFENGIVEYEHISFVLGSNYVISFQEKPGDLFRPVRDRLQDGQSGLREGTSDYLFYRLIDTVVDSYFHILENLGESVELLEDRIFEKPGKQVLQEIQSFKKEVVHLRKAVYPLREAVSKLSKNPTGLINPETHTYFKDVYDHVIHIIESVETTMDLASGLMDMYMNMLSNRMNEVMKVLTIMASIFIPLTFIAGIYGMNFEHMPELSWQWGYPVIWLVMVVVAIGMLFYFKKKTWL